MVVRVAAPPVDGRANAALCRLVARAAGVRIHGADAARIRAALGIALV